MDDAGSEPNGFGYTTEVVVPRETFGVQVAEGKDSDTLEPLVIMRLRWPLEAAQVSFAFDPDLADQFADELRRWAQRARAKHYR